MIGIDEGQQAAEVRALRAQGLPPKQIARALGLRPSEVVAVLNQAVSSRSSVDEQALVRCWVSRGWANEVLVNGHHEWPGLDDDVESPGGLVCVLVARRHRYDKVAVCGYLVDVHCLGVKNSMGPEFIDEVDRLPSAGTSSTPTRIISWRRSIWPSIWSSAAWTTPAPSGSSRTLTTPTPQRILTVP